MTNMLKKVFNWSEVHLSEMTCYKIHTLKSISRDNICFHMKLYYSTRDAIQLEAIDILLNLRYVTWVLGKLTVLIRSGTYVGNAQ